MDETAIAFELPHVAGARRPMPARRSTASRCATTSAQVEIGAFRTERGVTQRIRFNVVLEVSHHAAAQDDDVDKVISYDTITEAIEHELAAERINLLETLAERVAARCLADPPRRARLRPHREARPHPRRARRRDRAHAGSADAARAAAAGRAAGAAGAGAAAARGLPRARIADGAGRRLARRAGRLGPPVRPLPRRRPRRSPPAATEAQRRIGLLAIEQAAWAFADGDPRFGVAATRTELDWALKSGRLLGLGAVAHGGRRARPAGARRQRPGRARRLARGELGAEMLVVAGARAAGSAAGCTVRAAAAPEDLAALA